MKRFGKLILAVVLVGAIGFAGFMLGSNVDLGHDMGAKDKELISEMDSLKGLLDKNFLFDYKDEDLYNGALKGMFANLGDPYTSYYPKDEYKKLMENLDGRYKGIGVTVSASKEGLIKVVQVFENSPAKEAGMKAGDFIKSVEELNLTLASLKRQFL